MTVHHTQRSHLKGDTACIPEDRNLGGLMEDISFFSLPEHPELLQLISLYQITIKQTKVLETPTLRTETKS